MYQINEIHLKQGFSTGGDFGPQGNFSMSGDIFDCYEMQRPGMLLNTPQCTG